jgi:hypothetical protein
VFKWLQRTPRTTYSVRVPVPTAYRIASRDSGQSKKRCLQFKTIQAYQCGDKSWTEEMWYRIPEAKWAEGIEWATRCDANGWCNSDRYNCVFVEVELGADVKLVEFANAWPNVLDYFEHLRKVHLEKYGTVYLTKTEDKIDDV